LITRRPDPADARRTLVSVTDQGRESVTSAYARQEALATAISQLTKRDQTALEAAVSALQRIGDNLSQETK
jgi:DNA-binding MarR family transcriptional regulator